MAIPDPQQELGAAAALARWLRTEERSYRWLAEHLAPRVSRSAVALWVARATAPQAGHRPQIEHVTNGTARADDWLPSLVELRSAERVLFQHEVVLQRLGAPTRYLVLDHLGTVLLTCPDVAFAKRFYDCTEDAAQLLRAHDGAPLGRKTAHDPAADEYLLRRALRAG